MRAALYQMSSSDDPVANAADLVSAIAEAARQGADMVLTPEVSNCISSSRAHQRGVLALEEDDATLAAVKAVAAQHSIWVLLGSLALLSGDEDGRFANRSFLIDAEGAVRARYDKIHMFDVTLSETESYRESDGYRPGEEAVVADTPWGRVGLSICYDLRFPHLYRGLAHAGATIITVPAAFSVPTGEAHWHTLLRARAIETGSFVLAPAQTGAHAAHQGRPRRTYGHSLAVGPWGEVLADAGTDVGLTLVDLPLGDVERARGRVPSLTHDRPIKGPVA
ncbi:MAG: carbon-nitrogen hydrolase family protein [Pseudomonadota bacterium]